MGEGDSDIDDDEEEEEEEEDDFLSKALTLTAIKEVDVSSSRRTEQAMLFDSEFEGSLSTFLRARRHLSSLTSSPTPTVSTTASYTTTSSSVVSSSFLSPEASESVVLADDETNCSLHDTSILSESNTTETETSSSKKKTTKRKTKKQRTPTTSAA